MVLLTGMLLFDCFIGMIALVCFASLLFTCLFIGLCFDFGLDLGLVCCG